MLLAQSAVPAVDGDYSIAQQLTEIYQRLSRTETYLWYGRSIFEQHESSAHPAYYKYTRSLLTAYIMRNKYQFCIKRARAQ